MEIVRKAYYSEERTFAPDVTGSHYHDCHEILLVVRGKIQVAVGESTHTAEAGSVVLFNRLESHSITVCSEEYHRFVLQLSPSLTDLGPFAHGILMNRPEGFDRVLCAAAHTPTLTALFRQLIRECAEPDGFSREMTRLLVNQLLIGVARLLPVPPRWDETVDALQNYLERKLRQQHTLSSLARRFSVSPSSLSHRFKKQTGVSVMGYLFSLRLAAAKTYLAETTLSVGEIVEKCGFSDNSNFSRTFKAQTGLSPTQFRQKYQWEL